MTQANHTNALLTPREAAAALGVSTGTVRRLRQDGALRTVRLGYRTVRVFEADLKRLLARRTERTTRGRT